MPRNADPGLAQTYSKPSDLKTSIMKSAPGRSVVWTSTGAGAGSAAAMPAGTAAAIAAADVAAVDRKLRRPTSGLSELGIGRVYRNSWPHEGGRCALIRP